MFQVSTGDGWAPYIARPLVGNESPSTSSSSSQSAVNTSAASTVTEAIPSMNRAVALFFIFFFFVSGICLLGVVHAILLDEFMVAVQEERQRLKEEEIELKFITSEKLGSPLDPLLASLAHFHSSIDLSNKIKELFLMIDANGSGSLDYQEICDGLKALEGFPVKLSLEDLDTLTENRALCNADGELDLPAFERLIRHQLQLYVIRTLAAAMEKIDRGQLTSPDEHTGVMLFVLKLLIANMGDFVHSTAGGKATSCSGGAEIVSPAAACEAAVPESESVQAQLSAILAREDLILDLLRGTCRPDDRHACSEAAGTNKHGSTEKSLNTSSCRCSPLCPAVPRLLARPVQHGRIHCEAASLGGPSAPSTDSDQGPLCLVPELVSPAAADPRDPAGCADSTAQDPENVIASKLESLLAALNRAPPGQNRMPAAVMVPRGLERQMKAPNLAGGHGNQEGSVCCGMVDGAAVDNDLRALLPELQAIQRDRPKDGGTSKGLLPRRPVKGPSPVVNGHGRVDSGGREEHGKVAHNSEVGQDSFKLCILPVFGMRSVSENDGGGGDGNQKQDEGIAGRDHSRHFGSASTSGDSASGAFSLPLRRPAPTPFSTRKPAVPTQLGGARQDCPSGLETTRWTALPAMLRAASPAAAEPWATMARPGGAAALSRSRLSARRQASAVSCAVEPKSPPPAHNPAERIWTPSAEEPLQVDAWAARVTLVSLAQRRAAHHSAKSALLAIRWPGHGRERARPAAHYDRH